MMELTNRIVILLLILVALSMAGGCSSGSSGGGSGGPTITGTGKFIDGPVSGLSYTSESYSGVTDENGEFKYKRGDVLSFSYLNIELGQTTIDSARSDAIVSPRNLAENSDSPDMLLNILRFLQTLDEDGDHDGGIQLPDPESVTTAITAIDFDSSEAVFEADASVVQLISDVAGATELIESETALSNFEDALEEEGVHPLEGLTVYRYENGSQSELGLDHTSLWCDTWRFSNGKVYVNDRVIENLNECTDASTPFGDYAINNDGDLVWTANFGEGAGTESIKMVLLNDSAPFLYRFGDITGDRERNRLYLTKNEVATLLASSSFEANGDLLEVSLVETSPSFYRLEGAFRNRSCTLIQNRYDRVTITSTENEFFNLTSFFTQQGDDCVVATIVSSPADGTKYFVVPRGADGIGLENLKASIVFNE